MKLERRDDQPETQGIRDALAALAAHPGVTDDPAAARAFAELRARLQPSAPTKAQQLAHAAELVAASLDRVEILRTTLALALEIMHAERGFLMLREGRELAAVDDAREDDGDVVKDSPAPSIVERVLETGEPVFTSDTQADRTRHASESLVALYVRSIACVPLRVRDVVLGAIYLESRTIPGLLQTADPELLSAFAHQAALALENARLFGEERERTKRLTALQEFQARLLEAIANGVITLSGSRQITSFNRAAETTFGVDASEMLGGEASALAAFVPKLPEMLGLFFDNGAVLLRAEVEARRRDGARVTIELRLTPLETPEGTGVVLVVTDITQQRRLAEERIAERARAEAIQQSFSRYLAPHVVQSLVRNPASVQLGGERIRATMLFADIRGFTKIAASLAPERVVEILNAYFEEAVKIIFEFDGLLDKFYGDGLMAVFGAPRAREDDAQRAVAAALRLTDVVRNELAERLAYPLAISTGLATGDVVAGHFGSQRRMDYTVIGDAVNLAQGLQNAAPPGGIYLDEETFRLSKPLPRAFHRVGARLKGRGDIVTVYAILPESALETRL